MVAAIENDVRKETCRAGRAGHAPIPTGGEAMGNQSVSAEVQETVLRYVANLPNMQPSPYSRNTLLIRWLTTSRREVTLLYRSVPDDDAANGYYLLRAEGATYELQEDQESGDAALGYAGGGHARDRCVLVQPVVGKAVYRLHAVASAGASQGAETHLMHMLLAGFLIRQ
eukprot:CAMPEP_0115886350 /NCGR_PEP_ID=MMETSP0287-20121206/31158_1 /TAXON_ID=412157 /ORGANISM="Chrysochromulina rotalis, Strain UIO044" /LENGTH=169 /DNA_ID=CAMNT_0003342823 /DNA_START=349 /DNA_END=856 /DNA_ORIENTATION=-